MRSGAPRRDLPAGFGPWQTTYDLFLPPSRSPAGRLRLVGAMAGLRGAQGRQHSDARACARGEPAGGQLAQVMGRSRSSLSTNTHLAYYAHG